MKKLILTILTFLTLTQTQAFAKGAESGGGGNGGVSSYKDIIKFVMPKTDDHPNLRNGLPSGLKAIQRVLDPNSGFRVENKRRILLQQMISNPTVLGIINNTVPAVYNVVKGNCFEPGSGQARDASVKYENGNYKFCFSADRLQRYPMSSLHTEITALAFHELAHVAGIGNENDLDAQLVGDAMTQIFTGICSAAFFVKDLGRVNISIKENELESYEWKGFDVKVAITEEKNANFSPLINPSRGFHKTLTYHVHPENFKLNWNSKRGSMQVPIMKKEGELTVINMDWNVEHQNVYYSASETTSSPEVNGVIIFGCRVGDVK